MCHSRMCLASFTGLRGGGGGGLPGQNRVAQDLRELTSWLTPTEDFFAIGHYGYPEVDASSYRLQVTGLVERPLTLTLDELKARPRVEPQYRVRMFGKFQGTDPWYGGERYLGRSRAHATPR